VSEGKFVDDFMKNPPNSTRPQWAAVVSEPCSAQLGEAELVLAEVVEEPVEGRGSSSAWLEGVVDVDE